MSRQRPERLRLIRWLVPGVLVALAPKCALCVLGYLGLGAALGLGGPEICGATDDAGVHRALWFLAAGIALGAAVLFLRMRRRA